MRIRKIDTFELKSIRHFINLFARKFFSRARGKNAVEMNGEYSYENYIFICFRTNLDVVVSIDCTD